MNRWDETKLPNSISSGTLLLQAMQRLEKKVDDISEKQADYIQRTVKIESLVTNGMSSSLEEIKNNVSNLIETLNTKIRELEKSMESKCIVLDRRLTVLEEFAWFRNFMTNLRNNFFLNLLTFAILGGLVAGVAYFGLNCVSKFLN